MSAKRIVSEAAPTDEDKHALSVTSPETPSKPSADEKPPRKARAFTTTVYLENSDLKHSYILVKTGKVLTGIYEFSNATGELTDISGSVMMRAAGEHILRAQRSLLVKLAEYRLEVAETGKRPFHPDTFGALLVAASQSFAAAFPATLGKNS